MMGLVSLRVSDPFHRTQTTPHMDKRKKVLMSGLIPLVTSRSQIRPPSQKER